MFVLFADSDCDVTPVDAEKYGFRLISMPYSIDEKEVYPYEDFKEFKDHEFYEVLRGGVVPKTSAISPVKYVKDTYFNYETDGFGKVTHNQEELIEELKRIIKSNSIKKEYIKRINEFFTLNDEKNCERIYKKIVGDNNG